MIERKIVQFQISKISVAGEGTLKEELEKVMKNLLSLGNIFYENPDMGLPSDIPFIIGIVTGQVSNILRKMDKK